MMALGKSDRLRGLMLENEPLSRHTSWRVGGPARQFYRPADSEDLLCFLQELEDDEPLLWLGLGSNLLVRDLGFDGTVVATRGRLEGLEVVGDGLLRVEVGVACAKVARMAAREGLTGSEFLAGIPGTMGGALAMNAGAFGGETWNLVKQVETVDRHGHLQVRLPGEFDIGYRQVTGPEGEWFIAAQLQLEPGDVESAQERIRGLLARRSATQPVGLPSCGSVFTNPEGDHAARLIEAANLKGIRIGDACVSKKHANFIINQGEATAADIEQLIRLVQQRVEWKFGVRLGTEVRIVGEQEGGS
ncbi:MAG: UDP-N-acetylmuramate dehydrogenase [Gammaproteobacteria bacterium]|nr:UDP-N-acetylmuramate dehydrogenase [Gammaproteobacteria bacterium]